MRLKLASWALVGNYYLQFSPGTGTGLCSLLLIPTWLTMNILVDWRSGSIWRQKLLIRNYKIFRLINPVLKDVRGVNRKRSKFRTISQSLGCIYLSVGLTHLELRRGDLPRDIWYQLKDNRFVISGNPCSFRLTESCTSQNAPRTRFAIWLKKIKNYCAKASV